MENSKTNIVTVRQWQIPIIHVGIVLWSHEDCVDENGDSNEQVEKGIGDKVIEFVLKVEPIGVDSFCIDSRTASAAVTVAVGKAMIKNVWQ